MIGDALPSPSSWAWPGEFHTRGPFDIPGFAPRRVHEGLVEERGWEYPDDPLPAQLCYPTMRRLS
jgi:hypothetical protein